jgi:hypothetical protein
MKDGDLLLSICIPTNGASQWIIPTLRAIYSQDIDINLFEVVIADNGENSTLVDDLSIFHYTNLRYIRTEDKGFLNLVTALQQGNGLLRKMLNHRSVIVPGTINHWLEIVSKYKKDKPIIYFSDNQLKKGGFIDCPNLDAFIYTLSYWASWSAGLSIWDIDVKSLDTIEFNKMFPNTSLLLNIRQQPIYVICDEKYQNMQDEAGKGGYDLFHTFAVTFLDILSELRIDKRISESTFIFVKKELLKFLFQWYQTLLYHKKKYSFLQNNICESLLVYYSKSDYYCMKMYPFTKGIFASIRNKINNLIGYL